MYLFYIPITCKTLRVSVFNKELLYCTVHVLPHGLLIKSVVNENCRYSSWAVLSFRLVIRHAQTIYSHIIYTTNSHLYVWIVAQGHRCINY